MEKLKPRPGQEYIYRGDKSQYVCWRYKEKKQILFLENYTRFE